jgi:hypothetical protein
MSDKDRAEKVQTDHAGAEEPAAGTQVDFAFWDVPGTAAKVIYSLPLFHEIDFVVNESYRKIPHGGIEAGGLLYGVITEDVVRIEAFRAIECEHASGPSLQFSEQDLTQLEEQLTSVAVDGGLEKLRPVGWFLAHTRGPLDMTETELKHFARFFPEPLSVTVLVKPERFQPTRFGFLVRKADGEMPREATSSAVILPLPGRSHKPGQLIPSLAAPTPNSNAKRALQRAEQAEESERKSKPGEEYRDADEERQDYPPAPPRRLPREVAQPKPEVGPASIWKIPPDAEITEAEAEAPLEVAEEQEAPYEDSRTPEERAARKRLARDRARLIEQAFPAPEPLAPAPPPPVPFRPAPLPSLPANVARNAPLPYGRYAGQTGFGQAREAPRAAAAAESVLGPKSVTALALAALLGCLVGYVAYLQLPAPVIPIDVRPANEAIVVSWPPDESRNSIYAAIRLNDGPPVPLSSEEKRIGRVSLTAAKDFKVEVMARNWIRDSRGIVRYVHSPVGNGRLLPSDSLLP